MSQGFNIRLYVPIKTQWNLGRRFMYRAVNTTGSEKIAKMKYSFKVIHEGGDFTSPDIVASSTFDLPIPDGSDLGDRLEFGQAFVSAAESLAGDVVDGTLIRISDDFAGVLLLESTGPYLTESDVVRDA